MPHWGGPKSQHKVIILSLIALNLMAIVYAVIAPGQSVLDYHFKEGAFIVWLGSAQMLGAAFLFAACYFANLILPRRKGDKKDETISWLVFAIGFLILALDQQFRLRENLTLFIDTHFLKQSYNAVLHVLLKVLVVALAIGLVFRFRVTVLANFRMVLAFFAGFWFLVLMLLIDMIFESLGLSSEWMHIVEGSAKLLAMAMFLSASYSALLDRLLEAKAELFFSVQHRFALVDGNVPLSEDQLTFEEHPDADEGDADAEGAAMSSDFQPILGNQPTQPSDSGSFEQSPPMETAEQAELSSEKEDEKEDGDGATSHLGDGAKEP